MIWWIQLAHGICNKWISTDPLTIRRVCGSMKVCLRVYARVRWRICVALRSGVRQVARSGIVIGTTSCKAGNLGRYSGVAGVKDTPLYYGVVLVGTVDSVTIGTLGLIRDTRRVPVPQVAGYHGRCSGGPSGAS